jgi:hypothetical protein
MSPMAAVNGSSGAANDDRASPIVARVTATINRASRTIYCTGALVHRSAGAIDSADPTGDRSAATIKLAAEMVNSTA